MNSARMFMEQLPLGKEIPLREPRTEGFARLGDFESLDDSSVVLTGEEFVELLDSLMDSLEDGLLDEPQ